MIIKHYAVFETQLESEELNQKSWDILRTKSAEKAYAIEDSIEEYEENCNKSISYEESAKNITEILKKHNCKHVVSFGVGKGILEWQLKKQMPDLYIECTDYADEAIEKLKKVFVKGDAFHRFDMLEGDYHFFDKDAFFILYRVSAEFCYENWCKVIRKMGECGFENILFVPENIATKELEVQTKKEHEERIKQGIQDTFCGWIYSEDILEEIFKEGEYWIREKCQMGNLVLYFLKQEKAKYNIREDEI